MHRYKYNIIYGYIDIVYIYAKHINFDMINTVNDEII